jgi:hypothetical protein
MKRMSKKVEEEKVKVNRAVYTKTASPATLVRVTSSRPRTPAVKFTLPLVREECSLDMDCRRAASLFATNCGLRG